MSLTISSTSSINTNSTLNTENLLNCKYPFLFMKDIVEFKVQQEKYTSDEIFTLIEKYFEIDLKYTLNKINENPFYKEKYNILLTTIFSCISSLLIEDVDKKLIQKIINNISDAFESVVDTYCGFNINKSFYHNYFNIYTNSSNISKSSSSILSCEKQSIIESYLEESIKNINEQVDISICENYNKSNEKVEKLNENKINEENVNSINLNNNESFLVKEKTPSIENIVNKLQDNIKDEYNENNNFTEEKNNSKINGKVIFQSKKRGPYKKDGKQEKLINKIVNKLFNQKINNRLLFDIKKQNRNTMDLYVKIYKEYENDEKVKYKDIILNYDKNITRYEIVNKIYNYIIKNNVLYDSNIIFFYHTFDGLRSENVNDFIIVLENKFTEWIKNKKNE